MKGSGKVLRYGTWSAHSVLNKRAEIEALLSVNQLDFLSITETWLSSKIAMWQIPGYVTFRCDRETHAGGGTLILVKSSLIVSPIKISNNISQDIECVGVKLETVEGYIQVISVYSPPNVNISSETGRRLIECSSRDFPLIMCGDFNAHSWLWGSRFCSPRGDHISEALEEYDLVPLNDSDPTYIDCNGRLGGVIDLIFVSATLCKISTSEVTSDTFTSDHFLVLAQLDSTPKYIKSNTNRYNLSKVDWPKFSQLMDSYTESSLTSMDQVSSDSLEREYEDLVDEIRT